MVINILLRKGESDLPSHPISPPSTSIRDAIPHASPSARDAVSNAVDCTASDIADASDPALYFLADPIVVWCHVMSLSEIVVKDILLRIWWGLRLTSESPCLKRGRKT